LGCCFWRTIKNHMEQIVTYMKQGENAIQSNVMPAKTKYILDRRRCNGKLRECSDTISYTKKCVRTACRVKDRYSR
jgi:hypothetical protein